MQRETYGRTSVGHMQTHCSFIRSPFASFESNRSHTRATSIVLTEALGVANNLANSLVRLQLVLSVSPHNRISCVCAKRRYFFRFFSTHSPWIHSVSVHLYNAAFFIPTENKYFLWNAFVKCALFSIWLKAYDVMRARSPRPLTSSPSFIRQWFTRMVAMFCAKHSWNFLAISDGYFSVAEVTNERTKLNGTNVQPLNLFGISFRFRLQLKRRRTKFWVFRCFFFSSIYFIWQSSHYSIAMHAHRVYTCRIEENVKMP